MKKAITILLSLIAINGYGQTNWKVYDSTKSINEHWIYGLTPIIPDTTRKPAPIKKFKSQKDFNKYSDKHLRSVDVGDTIIIGKDTCIYLGHYALQKIKVNPWFDYGSGLTNAQQGHYAAFQRRPTDTFPKKENDYNDLNASGAIYLNPLPGKNTSHLILVSHSSKSDTIPVIMLVCDTTTRDAWRFDVDADTVIGFIRKPNYPSSYWLRGYSITKPNNTTTYLDADKKPLPKSIVVWMVKSL